MKQKIEGQFRHLLSGLGLLLVGLGFLEVDQLQDFNKNVISLIGGAMYSISSIRSWITKVDPNQWRQEIAKEMLQVLNEQGYIQQRKS